nr:hypothetical protein [Tanacetum cinerariifolium]
MVAFLKKLQGSKDFHQIVDFLNASHIRTLNNGEIELNATFDGQDKTITEASIRRHLKLADVDDSRLNTSHKRLYIAPALTHKVFSNMKRETRGFTGVETPLFSTMLVSEQLSQGEGDSPVHARPERLSNLPNEPPRGEGKELEKKLKHKRQRAVVDSSEDEEASLDKEDSPKQGRMIKEINEDENTNLVKSNKQREAHETAGCRKESDDTKVVDFNTACPQKDDDEETLAKTLVSIKKSAAKDKVKAIMQESEPLKKIKKKEMIQISLDEEIA